LAGRSGRHGGAPHAGERGPPPAGRGARASRGHRHARRPGARAGPRLGAGRRERGAAQPLIARDRPAAKGCFAAGIPQAWGPARARRRVDTLAACCLDSMSATARSSGIMPDRNQMRGYKQMSDTIRRNGAPQVSVEEELAALGELMSRPLDEGDVAPHRQEVGQHIVDGLRRLLGADGCRLYAVEVASDLQRLATSPIGEIPELPTDDDAVGRAFRERRIVSAPDGAMVLALPLFCGDRTTGVLEVRRRYGLWTREDVRLARIFADQAAIVLETARLVTESRQRRLTAEALALMAHATSRSFNVTTLGREIVDTLLLLLRCARATLFELTSDGFRLVAVARASGFEAADDVTAPGLGPVEARALNDRRLLATSDFLADPGMPGREHRRGAGEAPIRAMLAIPLFHDDAPIGILSVGDIS